MLSFTFFDGKDKIHRAVISRDGDASFVFMLTSRTCGGDLFSITSAIVTSDGGDTETIPDFTDDHEDALRIFELVADGCVSPCTLGDVVCDIMKEGVQKSMHIL